MDDESRNTLPADHDRCPRQSHATCDHERNNDEPTNHLSNTGLNQAVLSHSANRLNFHNDLEYAPLCDDLVIQELGECNEGSVGSDDDVIPEGRPCSRHNYDEQLMFSDSGEIDTNNHHSFANVICGSADSISSDSTSCHLPLCGASVKTSRIFRTLCAPKKHKHQSLINDATSVGDDYIRVGNSCFYVPVLTHSNLSSVCVEMSAGNSKKTQQDGPVQGSETDSSPCTCSASNHTEYSSTTDSSSGSDENPTKYDDNTRCSICQSSLHQQGVLAACDNGHVCAKNSACTCPGSQSHNHCDTAEYCNDTETDLDLHTCMTCSLCTSCSQHSQPSTSNGPTCYGSSGIYSCGVDTMDNGEKDETLQKEALVTRAFCNSIGEFSTSPYLDSDFVYMCDDYPSRWYENGYSAAASMARVSSHNDRPDDINEYLHSVDDHVPGLVNGDDVDEPEDFIEEDAGVISSSSDDKGKNKLSDPCLYSRKKSTSHSHNLTYAKSNTLHNCKYCERTKACDTSCLLQENVSNNDDLGDFIEVDMPQRNGQFSNGFYGYRGSTSSNEDDDCIATDLPLDELDGSHEINSVLSDIERDCTECVLLPQPGIPHHASECTCRSVCSVESGEDLEQTLLRQMSTLSCESDSVNNVSGVHEESSELRRECDSGDFNLHSPSELDQTLCHSFVNTIPQSDDNLGHYAERRTGVHSLPLLESSVPETGRNLVLPGAMFRGNRSQSQRTQSASSSVPAQNSSDSDFSAVVFSDSPSLVSPEFDHGAAFDAMPTRHGAAFGMNIKRTVSEENLASLCEFEKELNCCDFISGCHFSGAKCADNNNDVEDQDDGYHAHSEVLLTASASTNDLNERVPLVDGPLSSLLDSQGKHRYNIRSREEYGYRRRNSVPYMCTEMSPPLPNNNGPIMHSSVNLTEASLSNCVSSLHGYHQMLHSTNPYVSTGMTCTLCLQNKIECCNEKLLKDKSVSVDIHCEKCSLSGCQPQITGAERPWKSPRSFSLGDKMCVSCSSSAQTSDSQDMSDDYTKRIKSQLSDHCCLECLKRQVPPTVNTKRIMLWTEYEAHMKQFKQVGVSSCGVTAVLNVLKALGFPADRGRVTNSIHVNMRDEEASVPAYLLSRSIAGTTAGDLIQCVDNVTDGSVFGRFFHFFPNRDVHLLSWIGYWIKKGAVPVATLNIQLAVPSDVPIPDGWHHQMIHGVSTLKGVHLTNPLTVAPESIIMEQLTSPSVLMIQRSDVISRYNSDTDLRQLMAIKDPIWKTMNVLGQVVSVLREESLPLIPGYRPHVTSHISIPAAYKSGITLFIKRSALELPLLQAAPDLQIRRETKPAYCAAGAEGYQ